MMNPGYIALSIGPAGIRGVRARVNRSGSILIEKWAEKKWEGPASRNLSEREPEIGTLIRNLAGEKTAGLEALIALHPSWVLVKKVALPPTRAKETRQYLQLQVERQQTMLRDGEILWDYLPGLRKETGREGLLIMAKRETLAPVENALSACGVRLRRATVASFEDFLCLQESPRFPRDSEQALVKLEEEGAAVLEIRNGEIALCGWLPFPGPAEAPDTRFSLFALKFAEHTAGWKCSKTILWGNPEAGRQAARHLARLGRVEEFDAACLPPAISFAPAAAADSQGFPTELAGLLIRQTRKGALPLNLTDAAPHLPGQGARFGFLFRQKIAIPLAVLLILALIVSLTGARRIENHLYTKALANSAGTSRYVQAARENAGVLQRYETERVKMLDILLEVTKALPEGILLTSLRIDKKGQIQFSGNCGSLSQAEQIAGNINKSPLFAKAQTERTAPGPKGLAFTIKCTLRKKAGR